MKRPTQYLRWIAMAVSLAWASELPAQAAPIEVANASFESPSSLVYGGVFPSADGWTQTGPVDGDPPEFPGFQVPAGGPFRLDTGVFFNSPKYSNPNPPPDLLDSPWFVTNADGQQLAYLFAADQNDISFQQQLDTTFASQNAYLLKVAVGRSFFLPPRNDGGPDPSVRLSLFFEDDSQNLHSVAQTEVTLDQVESTLLTDFSVATGLLGPDHAAIGRPIGIQLAPAVGTSGVWTLDRVRLFAVPEPATWLLAAVLGAGLLVPGRYRHRQRAGEAR